jgi:molybdopterin-guanine dinucleotide biosynthesis protein A
MKNSYGISAYIIAGGRSTRFGEDKSLFPYLGKPMLERVVEVVRKVINKIAIIANDSERFAYLGLPCYDDVIAGIGSIGGLYSALTYADTDRSFIFACDMPELDPRLIEYMIAISGNYDVIVPLINGFYEPLHAVYSKSCLSVIQKNLKKGYRQIINFYNDVSVRAVEGDEIQVYADTKRVFTNINYRYELID